MLNYEFMTDNEILLYIKKGYLPDNAFDWTEYNKAQKSVEEEIPVVETPVETPTEEETPVAEPIAAETPAQKTKRSSKKAQK